MVTNITIWKVLEPLLFKEEFIHLAEISRKTRIPHPTARKYLNNFESKGILKKQIKGRLTMYKINYSNPIIIDYIILAEKEKLISRAQKDEVLKEIINFLHNFPNVVIFGSAAENLKEANDIDVLIIGGNINKNNIKDFEKKFGLKFHIINVKNISEVNNSLKEEIKKKHLIIEGSEEIVKWMIKN